MMNVNTTGGNEKSLAYAAQAAQARRLPLYDFEQQCLRILRCTARAMSIRPGGLRFTPGARPWLDGLPQGQPVAETGGGGRSGRGDADLPAAVN